MHSLDVIQCLQCSKKKKSNSSNCFSNGKMYMKLLMYSIKGYPTMMSMQKQETNFFLKIIISSTLHTTSLNTFRYQSLIKSASNVKPDNFIPHNNRRSCQTAFFLDILLVTAVTWPKTTGQILGLDTLFQQSRIQLHQKLP